MDVIRKDQESHDCINALKVTVRQKDELITALSNENKSLRTKLNQYEIGIPVQDIEEVKNPAAEESKHQDNALDSLSHQFSQLGSNNIQVVLPEDHNPYALDPGLRVEIEDLLRNNDLNIHN